MLNLGQLQTAALLLLFAQPAFAGYELGLSDPQNEMADPSTNLSITVRPGEKVSVVAEYYEKPASGGWVGQNRRAEDFQWSPSCDSSSPACPTVNVGSSIVVTIDVPICMPLGPTVITVTMPSPPDGGTVNAARLTLTNSEPPSICAGDGTSVGGSYTGSTTTSGMHANIPADVQAAQIAAAQNGGGANGYPGYNGGQAADPRAEMQRRWMEAQAAMANAPVYSNGSERGFNYGDQDRSSAVVMNCTYRGNRLQCRNFKAPPRKQPVRKAKSHQQKRRHHR